MEDQARGGFRAIVYHGGNLIPVGADLSGLVDIAQVLALNRRGCSSIVGPAAAVAAIWPALSKEWGPPRMARQEQPFMVSRKATSAPVDQSVRLVRTADLTAFLPAAVAMFTEELGISPLGNDSGAAYRARVLDLIANNRCLARFDRSGQVEFKAEIGALCSESAQIQGVWVRPDLRGQGIGTAAMAQVLRYALRLAPTASLYVNEFNSVARRMYERLGMRQIATLSTILF